MNWLLILWYLVPIYLDKMGIFILVDYWGHGDSFRWVDCWIMMACKDLHTSWLVIEYSHNTISVPMGLLQSSHVTSPLPTPVITHHRLATKGFLPKVWCWQWHRAWPGQLHKPVMNWLLISLYLVPIYLDKKGIYLILDFECNCDWQELASRQKASCADRACPGQLHEPCDELTAYLLHLVPIYQDKKGVYNLVDLWGHYDWQLWVGKLPYHCQRCLFIQCKYELMLKEWNFSL
jgi:hypothetical protein